MSDRVAARVKAEIAGREVIEGPISDEECDLLVRWRRTAFDPQSEEDHARYVALTIRFFTQMRQTERTDAFHEAGHIVVGHLLGYPTRMTYWQLDGTPSTAMDGISHDPPPFISEAQFLAQNYDWARIRVAGYLAERRAMGRSDPAEAVRLVRRMRDNLSYGPEETMAYLDGIENETDAILDENWEAVERLAQLLSENMNRQEYEIMAPLPKRAIRSPLRANTPPAANRRSLFRSGATTPG